MHFFSNFPSQSDIIQEKSIYVIGTFITIHFVPTYSLDLLWNDAFYMIKKIKNQCIGVPGKFLIWEMF